MIIISIAKPKNSKRQIESAVGLHPRIDAVINGRTLKEEHPPIRLVGFENAQRLASAIGYNF